MKKQESFSQSKGSAPRTQTHATRSTSGNSGKHIAQKSGWEGRKYKAGCKA